MTDDFVMAFIRVAHSAGQSHGQLFIDLLNEIVSEEPSAPQQCGCILYVNLFNRSRCSLSRTKLWAALC